MGNEHEKEEKLQRQNVIKSWPEVTPAAFEHLYRLLAVAYIFILSVYISNDFVFKP